VHGSVPQRTSIFHGCKYQQIHSMRVCVLLELRGTKLSAYLESFGGSFHSEPTSITRAVYLSQQRASMSACQHDAKWHATAEFAPSCQAMNQILFELVLPSRKGAHARSICSQISSLAFLRVYKHVTNVQSIRTL
jgi:hypothetical protein